MELGNSIEKLVYHCINTTIRDNVAEPCFGMDPYFVIYRILWWSVDNSIRDRLWK